MKDVTMMFEVISDINHHNHKLMTELRHWRTLHSAITTSAKTAEWIESKLDEYPGIVARMAIAAAHLTYPAGTPDIER